jgi:hypothetical protein
VDRLQIRGQWGKWATGQREGVAAGHGYYRNRKGSTRIYDIDDRLNGGFIQ